MIEVEVLGGSLAPRAPSALEITQLCARAAARRGVEEAHVAVEFVDATRIARLNGEHRGQPSPTDVLSFPIDGVEPSSRRVASAPTGQTHASAAGGRQTPPRELGDIVICLQYTSDVREAIVHGMLHLLGMDHESDDGEMLTLQRELLAGAQG